MDHQLPDLPLQAGEGEKKKDMDSGKLVLAAVLGAVGIGINILWVLILRSLFAPLIGLAFGIIGLVLAYREKLSKKFIAACTLCVCAAALSLYSGAWQVRSSVESAASNLMNDYYYYYDSSDHSGSHSSNDYESFFNEYFNSSDSGDSSDIWWD